MSKPWILILFCLLSSFLIGKESNIFSKAFAIAKKKTVKIYGGTIGMEHGYASGIIVSPDGQIITAIGMFLSSNNLKVTMPDGNVYTAEVLKRDRKKQLALLKIKIETPNYFDLDKIPNSRIGDWVLAIANPFKVADGIEDMSLTLGVISMKTELEVKRRTQDVEFEGQAILIDAITGNPGSQGGALVGIDGNLIGMVGKVLEYKGTNTRINYGIPTETLQKFIKSDQTVKAKNEIAYLGIHLFELSGKKAPAFIDRLDIGSPSFFSGLQKDDLIISVGDKKVTNCEDYAKAIKELVPQVKVQVLIKRKEDFYKVEVTPSKLEVDLEIEEKPDE